jgi:hypothetical protein
MVRTGVISLGALIDFILLLASKRLGRYRVGNIKNTIWRYTIVVQQTLLAKSLKSKPKKKKKKERKEKKF